MARTLAKRKRSRINRATLAALAHDPAALAAFVRHHGTHSDGSILVFLRSSTGGGVIVRGHPRGDEITIGIGSPLIPVAAVEARLEALQ